MLVTVATLGAVRYPETYKQQHIISVSVNAQDSVCASTECTTRMGRDDLATTGLDGAEGEITSDSEAKRSTELATDELTSGISQEDEAESVNVDVAPSTPCVRVCTSTDAAVVLRKQLISCIPGW